jgi:hypothetical protein
MFDYSYSIQCIYLNVMLLHMVLMDIYGYKKKHIWLKVTLLFYTKLQVLIMMSLSSLQKAISVAYDPRMKNKIKWKHADLVEVRYDCNVTT